MSLIEDIIYNDERPEEDMELDLAPLLGLMATLIPVLLLATAFLKLSSLNAKVPVVGEASVAIEKNKDENKEKKIGLYVLLNGEKTIVLNLKQGDKVLQTSRIPASVGTENEVQFDKDKFIDELVKYKTQYPNVFRARMNPTETVKYDDIAVLIDKMKVSPNSEQFPVTDKDTGKTFETNVMFDDVTFGNIMGDDE